MISPIYLYHLVYPEDELQDQVEKEEKNRVMESFCEKITVASIIEKNLPKLPTGYDVKYFRQCERMYYDFHPNILIVSKEKEFIDRNADRLDKEEELVSIFRFFDRKRGPSVIHEVSC